MTDVTLEQVAVYCTELGLLNRIDAKRGLVEAILVAKHGAHLVYFAPDAERQVLRLRIGRLVLTPSARRQAMARIIAHLNYNLLLKGFIFDESDGEVAYDLPIPFRGTGVAADLVSQCLMAATWTLNTHLPTVQQACWGPDSVEELLGLPLPEPAAALTRALVGDITPLPPPTGSGPADSTPA
jgi:hypothetical protein